MPGVTNIKKVELSTLHFTKFYTVRFHKTLPNKLVKIFGELTNVDSDFSEMFTWLIF